MVLTQGSYDIFHAGHVNFLRRSAKLGPVRVALLTSESYEKYRGYAPINCFENRKKVLEACKYVSSVFPTQPRQMADDIRIYKPDFLTIGTDWAKKDIYEQWGVTPEQIDDKLVFIPYTKGISSTEIKEKANEHK